MTTPGAIALVIETGVVIFYSYWLYTRKPLTWHYSLPASVLLISLLIAAAIEACLIQPGNIADYTLDTSEYFSHDHIMAPNYAGEEWACYVALLGPFFGLVLMEFFLPMKMRAAQLIHFLVLWTFLYLPVLTFSVVWVNRHKPLQLAPYERGF
jgi:hypothetical protein